MGGWLYKAVQGSAAALCQMSFFCPGTGAESCLSWSNRSHLLLYQCCPSLVEMLASPVRWKGCRIIVILDLRRGINDWAVNLIQYSK